MTYITHEPTGNKSDSILFSSCLRGTKLIYWWDQVGKKPALNVSSGWQKVALIRVLDLLYKAWNGAVCRQKAKQWEAVMQLGHEGRNKGKLGPRKMLGGCELYAWHQWLSGGCHLWIFVVHITCCSPLVTILSRAFYVQLLWSLEIDFKGVI